MVRKILAVLMLLVLPEALSVRLPALQVIASGHRTTHTAGTCTGTFNYNFVGSGGTPLHTAQPLLADTVFVSISHYLLTGSNAVSLSGSFATAGAYISCSASNTLQITLAQFVATGTQNNVCIMSPNPSGDTGYCAVMAATGGSTATHIDIYHNFSSLGGVCVGSWATNVPITIRISGVDTGTSTVLTVSVNGSSCGTFTDSGGGRFTSGTPLFYSVGNGSLIDNTLTNVRDF